MRECTVVVKYFKPPYGNKISFLKLFPVKSAESDERLKTVFKESFLKVHPTWTVNEVSVS